MKRVLNSKMESIVDRCCCDREMQCERIQDLMMRSIVDTCFSTTDGRPYDVVLTAEGRRHKACESDCLAVRDVDMDV
jgi:hypothetical protein